MAKREGCPVFCKDTGKTFKSIQSAARYLKVDSWTMARKMQAFGYFEDSKGNKYERAYPMDTAKKYDASTQPILQRCYHTRKTSVKTFEKEVVGDLPTPKKTTCDIVREACAEKILKMIQDSPIWKDICEIMDFCDIESFTIKKD